MALGLVSSRRAPLSSHQLLEALESRILLSSTSALLLVTLTPPFDATSPTVHDAAPVAAITINATPLAPASGFVFDRVAAIGTGGTVSTARAVVGAREGRTFNETDPVIPVAALRELLAQLAELPLAARKKTPGLPPPRADVVPAALVTLITVAEIGGFDAYQNSLYNLRFGLAAAALESPA